MELCIGMAIGVIVSIVIFVIARRLNRIGTLNVLMNESHSEETPIMLLQIDPKNLSYLNKKVISLNVEKILDTAEQE